MNRRLATAAAAFCLLAATITAAVPASATAGTPAGTPFDTHSDDFGPVSVHGAAGTVLTTTFTGFEGDAVRIEVDARADVNTDPRTTRGHFHVTHVHTDGRLVADFSGDITCLGVGGREAIATGVVTSGEAPWFPGRTPVGAKVALTVQGNGRHAGRVGWVWGMFGAPVSDCQGTVAFLPTTSGGFTVRG
ncbi:hypothetical protein ACFXDE_36165 [Kitasatospora sp. NPDC059408]|uniref:hypothetical protein n=1 Tax=Kitasatospora sp. NPDC059408 TaxID=3346823 RepID=UPI0036BB231B